MAGKSDKSRRAAEQDIYRSLRVLLRQLDAPDAPRKKGPGRPVKNRAETAPVILHLYKSQIRWLDDYAQIIQARRPDNVRLRRVEIVRGLLVGLARHALEHDLTFSADFPIRCERDLQEAIVMALRGKENGKG